MMNEIAVRASELLKKLEEKKTELRVVNYQILDIHDLRIDQELRTRRDLLKLEIRELEHEIETL